MEVLLQLYVGQKGASVFTSEDLLALGFDDSTQPTLSDYFDTL